VKFSYPYGATPVDASEAEDLLPAHITTQRELNEWEALNILQALNWAVRKKSANVLDTAFIRTLHRKMFDQTWAWAGKFRTSNKNIGVEWPRIPEETLKLCDDATVWIRDRVFAPDEIAVRFHHRLVWIHPFPNGNGRHARLMADLLIRRLGQSVFPWGGVDLSTISKTRKAYIDALRAADRGDIMPLLAFARSRAG
jgi:Fic-DOC domain mobile mystery protein B